MSFNKALSLLFILWSIDALISQILFHVILVANIYFHNKMLQSFSSIEFHYKITTIPICHVYLWLLSWSMDIYSWLLKYIWSTYDVRSIVSDCPTEYCCSEVSRSTSTFVDAWPPPTPNYILWWQGYTR